MAADGETTFSEAALAEYRETLRHYPTRQAALLPTIWLAQREFGWISHQTEEYIARLLELPAAHVSAVVSFYPMFHRKPVGKWLIDVCTNLSCRLRGADQIVGCIAHKLGIEPGQTTADGRFTLGRTECLASCATAPTLQLNHDRYYENLTVDSTLKLLDELAARGG